MLNNPAGYPARPSRSGPTLMLTGVLVDLCHPDGTDEVDGEEEDVGAAHGPDGDHHSCQRLNKRRACEKTLYLNNITPEKHFQTKYT